MRHIELFCDPSPVCGALENACNVLKFACRRHEPSLLLAPPSNEGDLRKFRTADLIVGISNRRDFNSVIASARLTRLRCRPFEFAGPIAVLGAPRESEHLPEPWLASSGIHRLYWPSLLVWLLKLRQNGATCKPIPSLECRPAWAFLAELNLLNHDINNFFNSIGDFLSDDDLHFAENLRQSITHEAQQGA